MRALIFATRGEAEAARARQDAEVDLPRVHDEREYLIARPGRAAERLRAGGIRTEHRAELLEEHDGVRFAVVADDGESMLAAS
jgi:hypothetical protein